MSDRRILMLENNLNDARTLISVLQSKVARQRDDITRLRDRTDTLMLDKKEITKKLNELRREKE
jgi:5-bromo-4-chloroindolyl phosphate hydrolysis protein